jgi:hypothetical protein
VVPALGGAVASDFILWLYGVAQPGDAVVSFYTRALHDDLARYSSAAVARRVKRAQLRNRSIRDLQHWLTVSRGGRLFVPAEPHAAVHTDASKFGYGGTLGFTIAAGTDWVVRGSGVWDAEDRREPTFLNFGPCV